MRSGTVSVVIPCYNAEKWIARAVHSVLGQHYPNLEIIVIDDGSTDGTSQVIRSLEGIRSIRTPNQGASRARNVGLGLANGESVLFLDADDYLEADSIGEWVSHIGEADIVFGPFVHERGEQRIAAEGPGPGSNAISIARQWLNGRYTPSCSTLWRTSFVRQIGGWAEGLLRNEDGEIVIRGLLKGARVGVANRGCGVYVDHDGGDRVSKRTGGAVSASEFSALEGLWTLAQARGLSSMKDSFALAFYHIAYHSFATGVLDIGHSALRRARELGMKGHVGSRKHKVLSQLLGLRNKLRLSGMVKRRHRVVTESHA
jgi:glycosyltransferase involved in cell wall biosynthesis